MRLTDNEVKALRESFYQVFESGNIYLFGSRVDDSLKGGDIDLYIQTDKKNANLDKKLDFLVSVKEKIGDQKIDVIISKDSNKLIEKEALQTGILL